MTPETQDLQGQKEILEIPEQPVKLVRKEIQEIPALLVKQEQPGILVLKETPGQMAIVLTYTKILHTNR